MMLDDVITEETAKFLGEQIDRLAEFIMREVPGEPSQNEGAVDTAIRIIGALRRRVTVLEQQLRAWEERFQRGKESGLAKVHDKELEILRLSKSLDVYKKMLSDSRKNAAEVERQLAEAEQQYHDDMAEMRARLAVFTEHA